LHFFFRDGASRMIGQTISHYRIVEKLGGGGMGVVYKAEDLKLGRAVALKFLAKELARDAQSLERFRHEARSASALNHPNIVTLHEIVDSEAGSFLVMEWVQGETLRKIMQRGLDLSMLAQYGIQAAQALRAAHEAGIIHRDIKPENIMVRPDGYVKLVDFGLARVTTVPPDSETGSLRLTQQGTLLGTLAYFSPEQARAEMLQSSSDIFSLGLVLYEAAAGRHPFAASSQFAIMNGILSQNPLTPTRLNPEIPHTLERLIMAMLEKDARLRPSASDVEQVLGSLRGSKPSEEALILRTVDRKTVGRGQELLELQRAFRAAAAGKGSLICVTGEPGIGKSTLLEEFVAELNSSGQPCSVARGRCSERLGSNEAYLPFLEALDSLLHSHSRDSVSRVMKTLAPSWYLEVSPAQHEDSSMVRLEDAKAVSQERLKRELIALLQEISKLKPLLLFFDDVHWSDVSTVDLLAYIAAHFESLHVLVAVTYRPTEMVHSKHPLLQLELDLQSRGLCREIRLDFLGQTDVERFLTLEFPGNRFPREFAHFIWEKTEGNPLFMVDLMRDLKDRKSLVLEQGLWSLTQPLAKIRHEIPASVRSMIQRKIEGLSEEDRRLLQAASVQGAEFHSAVLAQVLHEDPAEIEDRLDTLERVHFFVRKIGETEFPDGTLTLHLRFVHALYQNAVYAMLSPTRRVTLSSAAANTMLAFHHEGQNAIAHSLALLFEAARDFGKAAEFFQIAAQRAAGVFANQEAAGLARKGLELLAKTPHSTERSQKELALQITLGPVLVSTKGFASAEVEKVYMRARKLCSEQEESSQSIPVLWGLWSFYEVKGHLVMALELAEQMLRLAEKSKDDAFLLETHYALGDTLFWVGDFERSLHHVLEGIRHYDSKKHHALSFVYGGYDAGVACLSFAGWNLWMLGRTQQAVARTDESIALAEKLQHPFSKSIALSFGALLHQLRRDVASTRKLAEETISLCVEHGIETFLEMGNVMLGWAQNEENPDSGGVELIRNGIEAWRATGADLVVPHFQQILAAALLESGNYVEALTAIEQALALIRVTGDHSFEAECWRLKGDSIWRCQSGSESRNEAESCLSKAVEISRQQKALSLELRAQVSLSQLLTQRGEAESARRSLAQIYAQFQEDLDSEDLRLAKTALDALRSLAS
jgi:serine/threonine protein kinase/tetratricopeptide (TPR) repeat protein